MMDYGSTRECGHQFCRRHNILTTSIFGHSYTQTHTHTMCGGARLPRKSLICLFVCIWSVLYIRVRPHGGLWCGSEVCILGQTAAISIPVSYSVDEACVCKCLKGKGKKWKPTLRCLSLCSPPKVCWFCGHCSNCEWLWNQRNWRKQTNSPDVQVMVKWLMNGRTHTKPRSGRRKWFSAWIRVRIDLRDTINKVVWLCFQLTGAVARVL